MVIIMVAALIFIGPGKLPELARTLGNGMRELKRAMAGFESEARRAVEIPTGDAAAEVASEEHDEDSEAPPPPNADPLAPHVEAPEGPRVAAGRPTASFAPGEPGEPAGEPDTAQDTRPPPTPDSAAESTEPTGVVPPAEKV